MLAPIIIDYSGSDFFAAKHLEGRNWHSLSTRARRKVIVLQRVLGFLGPCTRPDDKPGECLVGQATFSFVHKKFNKS